MKKRKAKRPHQHSKGKQMKVFLKFLDVIFTIVIVVWNLIEILAIPALFLIIGLLNSFPWQYYAATIGGYFIIAIVIQIICHFFKVNIVFNVYNLTIRISCDFFWEITLFSKNNKFR